MVVSEKPTGGTHSKPLSGRFFRVIRQKYSDRPLSMEGSEKKDGRYHRRGKWGVLYLSEEAATAWREVEKYARARLRAYTTIEITVRLSKVADLTDEETLKSLELPEGTLVEPDFTRCQQLAGELREAGFEAILTWSAAQAGQKNLIVFADRLKEGSSVTITETD